MKEEKVLGILKSAILLEKRGENFYRKIAELSKNEEVADFFMKMSHEERLHARTLKEQYEAYQGNKKFDPLVNEKYTQSACEKPVDAILDPKLKNLIAAADFEAASISAAIAMEQAAIKLYSERAEHARDKNEKELYSWLVNWERGHLETLVELDKEIQEKIWYDNNFWPM